MSNIGLPTVPPQRAWSSHHGWCTACFALLFSLSLFSSVLHCCTKRDGNESMRPPLPQPLLFPPPNSLSPPHCHPRDTMTAAMTMSPISSPSAHQPWWCMQAWCSTMTTTIMMRDDEDSIHIFFFWRQRGRPGGGVCRQWQAEMKGGKFSGHGSSGGFVFCHDNFFDHQGGRSLPHQFMFDPKQRAYIARNSD